MYKITKYFFLALMLVAGVTMAEAQTWDGPGTGTPNNDVWRSGNVGIGKTGAPIARLDVRGSNIYLAPSGNGFSNKFVGLGESGGDCNQYGMRVQKNSGAFINVGVKQATGIQQFGADLPFGPTISWGATTPTPTFCPFPQTNCFADTDRPLDFQFDNDPNGCGDIIAQMRSADSKYQFIVYGRGYATTSWNSSDRRFKNDIASIEKPMEIVRQLRGVTYGYNQSEFPKMHFDDGRSYGFIAQELQKVMPELVREDDEGYLAVNYDGVIPVLVNALQEQDEVVDRQNEEIANLRREVEEIKALITGNGIGKAGADASSDLNTDDRAQLFQNQPNPFGGVTTIPYYLPQNVRNAQLQVFTIEGQEVVRMELSDRGNAEVTLDGNLLNAGIYTYSLIVDGQRYQTKRMVVAQ